MEANLHTDANKYQAGMGNWSKSLAPLFIEFIGVIKQGDRVLDVGCGTGSLTFTVADRTKASTVVGVDPSVGYVEYARAQNSHPHVTFEIGDAQTLPYDNGSFDCCVSSLMIQFVSDAETAAREMRRVTKKGGSVATCVWDNGGGMEVSEKFWDAVVATDLGAKRPGVRRYGSASALSELWIATRFTNVETKALVIPIEFSSFDGFWSVLSNSQGPPKLYISSLSDDGRRVLMERLRTDILGARPDGPIKLRAKAWAVRGVVPAE
jgi:SAM-dependent methyltransferase